MAMWGDTKISAVDLSCTAPIPGEGHTFVLTAAGVAVIGKIGSTAIAADAVLGEHLKGIDAALTGPGVDGNWEFNSPPNRTIAPGFGVAGSVYTANGPIALGDVVMRTGASIFMNGYPFRCRSLDLSNSDAVIHADGGAGGNGNGNSGGTGGGGGTAGATHTAHTLGVGGVGSAGGTGGNATVGGGNGLSAAARDVAASGKGGNGGAGGVGQTGSLAGGTAGTAGVVTSTLQDFDNPSFPMVDTVPATFALLRGGAGGGSGGGGSGGAATGGGGGGGSGSGGDVADIAIGTLNITNWSGRFSANGGAGGNGADTAGSGDGAGGGGGGGGAIRMFVRRVIGGSLIAGSNVTANGGAAGVSPAPGVSGETSPVAGVAGVVRLFVLSQQTSHDRSLLLVGAPCPARPMFLQPPRVIRKPSSPDFFMDFVPADAPQQNRPHFNPAPVIRRTKPF